MGGPLFLPASVEDELVKHVKDLDAMMFGITAKELMSLAYYEVAVAHGITKFSDAKKSAGKKWYYNPVQGSGGGPSNPVQGSDGQWSRPIPTKGDGRCFFRSVAIGLHKALQSAKRDQTTGEVVDKMTSLSEMAHADNLRARVIAHNYVSNCY